MKNRVYKSVMAWILILAMAAMSGCGSSGDKGTDAKQEKKEKEQKEDKMSLKTDVEMEEQILAEKDGVKITATGLGSDEEPGFFVNLSVKNDTDMVYSSMVNECTVNGYSVWAGADDIKPGESGIELRIGGGIFKHIDVGEIGEINLYDLRLFETEKVDSEDGEEVYYHPSEEQYDNPFFHEEKVTIRTSAYSGMKEANLPEGEEIYNENGIQIVRTEPDDEDKKDGMCSWLFLKNGSEDKLTLSAKDASVNDFVLDVMLGSSAVGGMNGRTTVPGAVGIYYAGVDSYTMKEIMNTEEDVAIDTLECTMVINKEGMDEFGLTYETVAEIPYAYTAK